MSEGPPHLAILGGGSAAFAGAHEALRRGARVTMFNSGLPLGGTCPNVGCVPSKTLIRAAETYFRGSHTGFRGMRLQAELADYGAIVQQKRDLVDGLRTSNYEEVIPTLPGFRLVQETAQLKDAHTLTSPGGDVTADFILLAMGTSPHAPEIPGLVKTPHLSNESAFELEELPTSLVVLGGGYIALECAQMFSRFGSRVTVLQRSEHVLSHQPRYVGEALTGYLREEGLEIVCGVALNEVSAGGDGVRVTARVEGTRRSFTAQQLLVATGRSPNTTDIGLHDAGVKTDAAGFVSVSDTLETNVPGVYAAGDVIGDPQFVYTASYEAELAVRNALGGMNKTRDYTALPWVIFTDPQVAGVGLDEEEARSQGFDAEHATLYADRWPRLKVARDMRGFVRLTRDKATDRLLGARIVAPEGGDLVTELGLAIRHGLTTQELAESFHPYLTLSEGIQRAAQGFDH